jgi:hypothetical protein
MVFEKFETIKNQSIRFFFDRKLFGDATKITFSC